MQRREAKDRVTARESYQRQTKFESCGEIVFYDGRTPLAYDLTEDACNRYRELLAVYEAKRPRRIKE